MTAHVLFVDDEEPNLVVFEAVCGDDFPVLTASSAAAGLQLMEEHEIGVVLTDQRMPGMTGIELLEKVEADYPDAIRLLITGCRRRNQPRACAALHAQAVGTRGAARGASRCDRSLQSQHSRQAARAASSRNGACVFIERGGEWPCR
ncbi:MAG: response regulator [Deltaproteobacteria bacterium]|nr:response regulator [Deltaproteobacteria bacterium]